MSNRSPHGIALVVLLLLGIRSWADPPPAGEPATDVSTSSSPLAAAALERTRHRVRYDGSYRRIDYPMGDVPSDVGVCSDVVVRSYRGIGIDLQQAVHRDMTAHFDAYPNHWGLLRPDRHIDHRRVPNLETFFRRHGRSLPPSTDGRSYRPGDVVSWRLPGTGLPHIGIVSDRKTPDGTRYQIVHNIGRGPELEDVLFAYPVEGHFRYPVPNHAPPDGR